VSGVKPQMRRPRTGRDERHASRWIKLRSFFTSATRYIDRRVFLFSRLCLFVSPLEPQRGMHLSARRSGTRHAAGIARSAPFVDVDIPRNVKSFAEIHRIRQIVIVSKTRNYKRF